LTVFIGGNHEASNYLRELYYGGWAAENIYFLGASGVVDLVARIKKQLPGQSEPTITEERLTIGGISGIEKHQDFKRGIFESFPYPSMSETKSVYHIREYEIEKFKLFGKISKIDPDKNMSATDIFLSHEWPQIVTNKN